MTERMTVALEDGTRALLIEQAGGERKVGAYLSQLVRDVHTGRLIQNDRREAMEDRLAKQEHYVSELEKIIPETIDRLALRIAFLERQLAEYEAKAK